MKNRRSLNLMTVLVVIVLHGVLILAVWHTTSPQLDIDAPAMSFVDLDSLDLGSNAKASLPESARTRTVPPKPRIKKMDKPVIKPVIKTTSKPDIVQKKIVKQRVEKQPVVQETPAKEPAPTRQADTDKAEHTVANSSSSSSSSHSGNSGGSSSGGAATQPTYKASYLNNPKPPYPAMSRENGEEGTVILSVTVEANGTASRVVVSRSSGYSRLDRSAQTAVAKYRFKPATRGGVPISYTYAVPINFSLR